MKGFTQTETKMLIDEALAAEENGTSLSQVFERIAIKTKRAKGTVRNYYYNIVSEENRAAMKEKFKEVSLLKVNKVRAFSEEEVKSLLTEINLGKARGQSVRKTIFRLAAGDEKLALRYQNKYRAIIKKQAEKSLESLPLRPEDSKYFLKLSAEIDALMERIKDKYAAECVKLKQENEALSREVKALKKQISTNKIVNFFMQNDGFTDTKG